jgi:hypothetical protein
MSDGAIIFVQTNFLGQFVYSMANGTKRFILITHNSDYPIPGPIARADFKDLLK